MQVITFRLHGLTLDDCKLTGTGIKDFDKNHNGEGFRIAHEKKNKNMTITLE